MRNPSFWKKRGNWVLGGTKLDLCGQEGEDVGMAISRFFLPSHLWSTSAALVGDEARHLRQVMRIQDGESVMVFDGEGRRAMARVLKVEKFSVSLELLESKRIALAKPRIFLAQAVPKGKNMDLIIQKSVELGVAEIQPLMTRHTVVQADDNKAEKWRRTALEACKQCGQDLLPVIAEPMSFNHWIEAQKATLPKQEDGTLRLIASLEEGAVPLRQVLETHTATRRATLLVGPEGDFSPDETSAAVAAGFFPISLGKMILRVETATFFAISALRYQFD